MQAECPNAASVAYAEPKAVIEATKNVLGIIDPAAVPVAPTPTAAFLNFEFIRTRGEV